MCINIAYFDVDSFHDDVEKMPRGGADFISME